MFPATSQWCFLLWLHLTPQSNHISSLLYTLPLLRRDRATSVRERATFLHVLFSQEGGRCPRYSTEDFLSHWPKYSHVPISKSNLHRNVTAMIILDPLGSTPGAGDGGDFPRVMWAGVDTGINGGWEGRAEGTRHCVVTTSVLHRPPYFTAGTVLPTSAPGKVLLSLKYHHSRAESCSS